jgi:hypothetical protein
VSGATRLQLRSRSVAAITALWLVGCGVLAMRHAATEAHVLDGAGAYVHANALTGYHTGHDSDIHGQRDPEADGSHCALLNGFHQATSADVAPPSVSCVPRTLQTLSAPGRARVVAHTDVYRLAPKTSPPAAG